MNSSSPIKLSIPVPCHQNWEGMSATERGRFCLSCQKEVFDFTRSTRAELESVVEKEKNVCGKVLSAQLDMPETKPARFAKPLLFIRKVAAVFFALVGIKLLSLPAANAQTITLHNPSENDLNKIGIQTQYGPTDSLIHLNGILKDSETKEGISFATVAIFKDEKPIAVTTTDIDGNLALSVNRKNFTGNFNLKMAYVGYKELIIENIPISKTKFNVQLSLTPGAPLLGEIIITTGRIITDIDRSSGMVDPYNTSTGRTFDKSELKHLPK